MTFKKIFAFSEKVLKGKKKFFPVVIYIVFKIKFGGLSNYRITVV